MADILIRMEMPKGCKSCKLSSDNHCNATGQWLFSTDLLRSGFNWKTCRLPDCPLHELPEHGDLVSKDDVMNAILGEPPEAHYPSWYASIVNEIPAIVPSNKEETE